MTIDFSQNIAFTIALIFLVWLILFFIMKNKKVSRLILIIRMTVVAILIFLTGKPEIHIFREITHPANHLLIIDNSESMDKIALEKMHNFSESIKDSIKLLMMDLDGKAPEPLDFAKVNFTKTKTDFTKIFHRLEQWHPKIPIQSAILITDGDITSGESLNRLTDILDAPIHILASGDSTVRDGLRLAKIFAKDQAKVGKIYEVEALLESSTKSETEIFLAADGNIVSSKKNANGLTKTVFQWMPSDEGDYQLRLSADSGQILWQKTVEVLPEKYKIFVKTGLPSFNSRILPKILTQSGEFEITNEIVESDAVLFLNYPNRDVSRKEFRTIGEHIARDQIPVVWIPNSMDFQSHKDDLEKLFSIRFGNLKQPKLSVHSQNPEILWHPILDGIGTAFWEELPPIRSLRINAELGKNAVSLLFSGNRTSIILSENSTICIFLEDLWRWHFSTAKTVYQDIFDRFLMNLFRFLTVDEGDLQFEVIFSSEVIDFGDDVEIRIFCKNTAIEPISNQEITISVFSDAGELTLKKNTDKNGYLQFVLDDLKPGKYDVILKDAERNFEKNGSIVVSHNRLEEKHNRLWIDDLRKISQKSGGFISTEPERVVHKLSKKSWIEKKKNTVKLWHNPWILLTVVVLLTAEWIARKKLGMF